MYCKISRKDLPQIMVAPNGARRTKQDHSAIPITIDETVTTAVACATQGAGGIHIHVRDEKGAHSLDAGLYREVLGELQKQVPTMMLQITTEAVGIYTPEEQRNLIETLRPEYASISIAEMQSDGDVEKAARFYLWCLDEGVVVQHILYGPEDLILMDHLLKVQPTSSLTTQMLFVLGRYTHKQESSPSDIKLFNDWRLTKGIDIDWAVCAFGHNETNCLVAAHKLGGKVRVGFENSLWNTDGTIAKDNAERVTEISKLISEIPSTLLSNI